MFISMTDLSTFLKGGVKSVQYVTGTVAASTSNEDVTISSVDVDNTVVHHLGSYPSNSVTTFESMTTVTLLNATTVRFTKDNTASVSGTVCYAVVVEYTGGIASIQQVSHDLAAADTFDDVTISSVDTDKTVLLHNGFFAYTSESDHRTRPSIDLTSSTTVQVRRQADSGSPIINVKFTVLEFN